MEVTRKRDSKRGKNRGLNLVSRGWFAEPGSLLRFHDRKELTVRNPSAARPGID